MKSSLIRPALALALAASLAACGGSDKAEFTVAGTVAGIEYDGLVLLNDGVELPIAKPAKAGDPVTFAFAKKLEYGDTYDVTVRRSAAHQDCGPARPPDGIYTNNADTAGRLQSINIYIACAVQTHVIGGTITGLTGTGLVLANGSTGGTFTAGALATPPAATVTYALPNVAYNVSYGVTVVTQPVGQVCTVANATGIMQDADITNINVTCRAA